MCARRGRPRGANGPHWGAIQRGIGGRGPQPRDRPRRLAARWPGRANNPRGDTPQSAAHGAARPRRRALYPEACRLLTA